MLSQAVQLSEGETVVATIRRHWFHLAIKGFIIGSIYLFLLAGVVLAGIGAVEEVQGLGLEHVIPLGLFVLGGVGLLFWMKFFASWSDHWLDAWIITNKRIIDIEQRGFFKRQVSSFPLDRIQDVTFNISGIIAMWLRFGDIRIQTASISDDLRMKQIPFPEDVKENIVSVIERARTAGQ